VIKHSILRAFKHLLVPIIIIFSTGCNGAGHVSGQTSSAMTPAPQSAPKLVEVSPGVHTVEGRLAGFDPGNSSVEFHLPAGSPGPLVLLIHGGGGATDNRNIMAALRDAGIAVLSFDAYRMNGFDRPSGFWVRNMTYEARQRMIYTTALAAYRWVVTQPGLDTRRIHIYGLSNGADVAANLAAVVDPAHVVTVFAEGTAGAGLGLPDRLAVPLRMIFGRLDNYAGQHAEDWRWQRRVPCRLNRAWPEAPPGNAAMCNVGTAPAGRTQSPGGWAEEQRQRGADVDLWFYDGGAHGIFLGPLRQQTMAWASGTMHASVGAEETTRQRLLADILARIAAAR
jgi:dienelactone hydrolase